jgi:hypothetical protein
MPIIETGTGGFYPTPRGRFDYARAPQSLTQEWRGQSQSGLRGLGSLGFSANLGPITIDSNSGGWSISDPSLNTTIASGTTSTIYNCPDPVPIQNAITTRILSPVSDAVSGNTSALTYNDLLMLWNALVGTENSWLAFLHNPKCTDSRWKSRAAGAESTLKPYFDGLKAKIQYLVNNLGVVNTYGGGSTLPPIPVYTVPGAPPSTQPVPTLTSGGLTGALGSSGTLILGALAIWFLSRMRR